MPALQDPNVAMRLVGWAALAVAVAIIFWSVWWWLPRRLANRLHGLQAKERADVEGSYRNSIAQVIGGLAILSGGWFTIQQQAETASAQRIAQYEKGFEGLKGSDVASHIGGAYELESLSRESDSVHDLVLGALSGSAVTFSLASRGPGGTLPLDAAAALQVVARSDNPRRYVFRLAEGSFQGADLGEAHLDGVDAHLVNFEGANLYKAHLFNANLFGATFDGANLAGSDFSHARVAQARFCLAPNLAVPQLGSGVPVPVQLAGSAFYSATASGAWFVGADLSGARFSDAKVDGAHFEGALLYQSDFDEANASGARFDHADARGAHFNSHATNGSGAQLVSASFRAANLEGAEFRGADLSGANFEGANLSGADLGRARVTATTVFKGARLCGARLPPGLVAPRGCATPWAQPAIVAVACPPKDSPVIGGKRDSAPVRVDNASPPAREAGVQG